MRWKFVGSGASIGSISGAEYMLGYRLSDLSRERLLSDASLTLNLKFVSLEVIPAFKIDLFSSLRLVCVWNIDIDF